MQRNSGQSAAVPDMAASTCSQSRSSRQMRPIAGSGSIAFEEVVPTVAQTKHGIGPARAVRRDRRARARRGAWRTCSSTSISRRFSRPIPAIFTAFSTEECACVEA